ncbi:unnamed protein product, partial [Mesorhabditis spiculigera]
MPSTTETKKDEPKKLKPCCACPETKRVRDECIIQNGEEQCGKLIEAHKQCMRDAGFNGMTDGASASNPAVGDEKPAQDDKMVKDLLQRAAALIRASNGLPRLGDNYEICVSYGSFGELMSVSRTRLQVLLQKVYAAAGVKVRFQPRDAQQIGILVDKIVAGNDIVTERTGILLDEIAKANRRDAVKVPKAISQAVSTMRSVETAPVIRDVPLQLERPLHPGAGLSAAEIARRRTLARHNDMLSKVQTHIKKPQKEFGFGRFIDNSSDIFKPKLVVKHNAVERPVGVTIIDDEPAGPSQNEWISDESDIGNPYKTELERFVVPAKQMESQEILAYKPLAETPLVLVDDFEKLEALRDTLNSVSIFAVDIEHHDHRSFLGFCCLIQISTVDTDYIVDPFKIWEHMPILNEPFSNPAILKVLHGADSDIVWLQRDFGIYVVNMFDTGRAMRHLGMGKYSLLYLVETLCGVQLNKEYQTTDWRVRPLPEEMIHYAREDTHYLLFCYGTLRERLIQAGNPTTHNLLATVYSESTALCGKIYEKPIFDPNGFTRGTLSAKRTLNNRQLFAMRSLWQWRDETARKEDESLNYILPAHMMFHIAESLPRDMQGILNCCSPVPPPVKEHLITLHRMVLEARDRPLEVTNEQGRTKRTECETLMAIRMRQQMNNNIDFIRGRLLWDDAEVYAAIENADFPAVTKQLLLKSYAGEAPIYERSEKYDIVREGRELLEKFGNVASPYECYQLAVKERDQRLEVERAMAKSQADAAPKEQRYSHHDPAVTRKPVEEINDALANSEGLVVFKEPRDDDDDEEEAAPDSSNRHQTVLEDDILTKKALKRRHQQAKKAVDIPFGQPAEKMLKKEPKVEGSGDFTPVDYSSYGTQMFEQHHLGKRGLISWGRLLAGRLIAHSIDGPNLCDAPFWGAANKAVLLAYSCHIRKPRIEPQ